MSEDTSNVPVEPSQQPTPQQAVEPTQSSWRDSLPDDLRNDATLSKYKSVDEVAKAYLNINKLIGKEKVVIPKEGDGEEVWDMWHKANGRPESPDKYDIKLPEGIQLDEQIEKDYREAFHKLGYNQRQIEGLMELRAKELAVYKERDKQKAQEDYNNGMSALKRELGDKFDDSLKGAQKVLREITTPQLAEKLEKIGLANDPDMVKMAIGISKLISNDTFANVKGVGMTPEKAADEISRIKSGGAYYDGSHSEHKAAVARVNDLLGFM